MQAVANRDEINDNEMKSNSTKMMNSDYEGQCPSRWKLVVFNGLTQEIWWIVVMKVNISPDEN